MWVTTSIEQVLKPNAIALGNFDGIHRGHQKVLQPILRTLPKEAVRVKDINNPYSTVVTFDPHPQEFFSGQSKQLLTPLSEKVKQLEKLGVEQLVLLPFNRELAALSPQQFVEEILVKHLQATCISVGQDFRFGNKRTGTAQDLKAIAANFGIEVVITSLYTCQYTPEEQIPPRISSSLIRQALAEGDILKANQMLGRAYTLTGTVVKGQQLGRTIGFPTANLELPPSKLLPRYGVYCVRVFIEDAQMRGYRDAENIGDKENNESAKNERDNLTKSKEASSLHSEVSSTASQENGKNTILSASPRPPLSPSLSANSPIDGVMNIGCRPTVEGDRPTIEVHLLDWTGDLYGQTVTVSLEKFLRPEQKFASLDALKTQITADCNLARQILQN